MSGYTIGTVAQRAGVGVETIRFYERKGLIQRPPSPRRGYRQYPDDVVQRLRFIRHAKELGFTLSEIRELLSLRAVPGKNCNAVKARAEQKLVDIDSKIRQLRKMKRALGRLVRSCDERDMTDQCATNECPILEALD